MSALYLGLMSGTSADGIDALIARFNEQSFAGVVAHRSHAYPPALREALLALSAQQHPITLARWAQLDAAVADCFAEAALAVLAQAGLDAGQITAIGSHGQTVFHAAGLSSLQLGDPNRIVARTGISTVADFRRRDVALGGHGAPLLPAFHHAAFARADERRCVLNLGGIANITQLPNVAAAQVTGFDTGPASGLMDAWCRQHRGQAYDDAGRWAQSGTVHEPLLSALLAEPYFQQPPPKSTGAQQFNLDWCRQRWPQLDALAPADVQRTLAELTARSVAGAVSPLQPKRLIVCGGGTHNRFLLGRIADLLSGVVVESSAQHGLDPQQVEACGFAWLAMRTMQGLPGNLPGVTGARGPAILGGVYRA